MAQIFTDFSGVTIGDQPPDTTLKRSAVSGDYTVRTDDSVNTLRYDTASSGVAARGIAYDLADSSGTTEIFVELKDVNSVPASARLVLFASDSPDEEYGVICDAQNDQIIIYKRVSGTFAALSTTAKTINLGAYYLVRFRVTPGSPNRLQMRLWTGTEPGTWDLDTTDSAFTLTSGWTGHIGFSDADSVFYKRVGIGTDGDPAPTAPFATTIDAVGVQQGQSIDNVTLTQSNVLQVAGISQGQGIDPVSLTQRNEIAPESLSQVQAVDNVILTQAHVIVPANTRQGQSTDNVELAVAGALSVDRISQPQNIDQALLTVAGSITVQGMRQAQVLEAIELTQAHILEVASSRQGQGIDATTLSADSLALAVNALLQGQTTGTPDLTQFSVLQVNGMTQQQIIDAVSLGGLVIGELEGQIVVYAALGGEVYSFPALSGTIH